MLALLDRLIENLPLSTYIRGFLFAIFTIVIVFDNAHPGNWFFLSLILGTLYVCESYCEDLNNSLGNRLATQMNKTVILGGFVLYVLPLALLLKVLAVVLIVLKCWLIKSLKADFIKKFPQGDRTKVKDCFRLPS